MASGVYPVIMCGGAGTRLWPASRPSRPKQFLPLLGGASLFRRTAERVAGLSGFERLIVVTGARQRDYVEEQLGELRGRASVILEPEGRDSAPAVAVALHAIRERDPDGVAVIVASDHHVPDADHFARDFDRAVEAAREGRIVTIGIRPAAPSSAYGYIRPGAAGSREGVSELGAFVEKPDTETAERYIADGYLWNSGNFIAPVGVFLDELRRHAPEVEAGTREAFAEAAGPGGDALVPLGERFRSVPKISVDYAVMEKTDRASVLASDIDWTDLGAWDAVHDASPKDEDGNAVEGDALLLDARGCLVHAGEARVVLSGVSGLVVTVEPDVVFVGGLDRAQGVKAVVERLKADGRPEVDVPARGFDLAGADAAMRRWMIGSALPLWFANGLDRETGLWRESLTQDGLPAGERPRGRVPGRQAWSFATGGALGWPGPWREAVGAGLDALRRYEVEGGLIRTLVDLDGSPASDTVFMYDQTFRMLALAAAGDAVDDAEGKALAILDAIEARFERALSGDAWGYREAGPQPYQSNAHMHLFEACLAWIEAGGAARWRETAGAIADLAAARFVDAEGGFLREFFEADWSPAAGEDGTVVEPGHQFEWAWLAARWARMSGDDAWWVRAERLFACGLRGVDPERGVAVDTMNERLERVTERARLWPQTEWLKAALVLHDRAAANGDAIAREDYAREAGRAHAALARYLDTPVPGLWRDKMRGDGTFEDGPAPASSFYHIAAAAAQLAASAAG